MYFLKKKMIVDGALQYCPKACSSKNMQMERRCFKISVVINKQIETSFIKWYV